MKKHYILGLVLSGTVLLVPIGHVSAQVYNPTIDSQRAQVQQILAIVQSLPSNTDAQMTQKIQLLQQALQIQLQINSATGYASYNSYNNYNTSLYGTGNGSNLYYGNIYGNSLTGSVTTPPYISMLNPSSGNVGTRINLQGQNIAVNDQVQILMPNQSYGYAYGNLAGQYVSAGVVDPGIGFIFPSVLGPCTGGYSIYTGACLTPSTVPVVSGSYGVRIMKLDGTYSNTQYFQLSTNVTGVYNGNNWAIPSGSFALNVSSYNPTSAVLSWPNAINSNYYRVLEILPNNQMNSITITSAKAYQINNLVAGSVHTYVVYGCSDSACNQVVSQSVPAVVSLAANVSGNYNYNYNTGGYNYGSGYIY